MRNLFWVVSIGLAFCLLCLGCDDSPTECCEPAITNAPQGTINVFIGEHYSHQFAVASFYSEEAIEWSVVAVDDTPIGDFAIDSAGVFTFTSDPLDVNKSFMFTVKANDAKASFAISVENRIPLAIDLGYDWTSPGYTARIPISKFNSSGSIGRFTLLIVYPDDALALLSVEPGGLLTIGEWEHFTYQYAGQGQSDDGHLLNYVRITSVADDPATSDQPASHIESSGELASLSFRVNADVVDDCGLLPISFAWLDCNDNSFHTLNGDTVLLSNDVYSWSGAPLSDTCTVLEPGTQCGTWDECLESGNSTVLRFVNFSGGLVETWCDPEVVRPGDINLNGIDNEIADMVLYSRYLLQSDTVFTINKAEQIDQSEINRDGYYLTVADMTYLARIITGDAYPFPKLEPFKHSVSVSFDNGTLSTESDAEIGSIWARFNVTDNFAVQNLTDMELQSNLQDSVLNVLVWAGTSYIINAIPSGVNDIFDISGGDPHLLYLEAADYDGNLMTVLVRTPGGVETFTPESRGRGL